MAPLNLFAAVLSLSAIASLVMAQDGVIYKGVDDKGRVVYASSPKGLRHPQKLVLPAPPISGTSSPAAPPPASVSVSASAPASNGSPPLDGPAPPDVRPGLSAAQAALAQASAEQDAGKEPLPGERLGTAIGGSRLAPAYFARQEALAKAVQAAASRLSAIL